MGFVDRQTVKLNANGPSDEVMLAILQAGKGPKGCLIAAFPRNLI
jgi:hypothetical protein